MSNSLKDLSKQDFTLTPEGKPTLEQIQASCLMRMADSSELMANNSKIIATNYAQLIKDLEYYKNAYKNKRADYEALERSNRALKGHITRLKNQKKF